MIEADPDREKSAVETLRWGLDLCLTHIDTAEMYGEGRVEQLVAETHCGPLQQRMQVERPSAELRRKISRLVHVFDLLYLARL
jgi:diketogulonate reductase-like aldo/keto reductase